MTLADRALAKLQEIEKERDTANATIDALLEEVSAKNARIRALEDWRARVLENGGGLVESLERVESSGNLYDAATHRWGELLGLVLKEEM